MIRTSIKVNNQKCVPDRLTGTPAAILHIHQEQKQIKYAKNKTRKSRYQEKWQSGQRKGF